MELNELLEENRRRNAALSSAYDPLRGVGCFGARRSVAGCHVPVRLLEEHPDYGSLPPLERDRLRVRYDFEFWGARCATIKDKTTQRDVPLVLNAPQRRLLATMEAERTAGRPVRIILLKARQWGGSTLVQLYMAWLQLVVHTGWNSLICGHLHQSARAIKRMYNLLLRHYPAELLPDEDDAPRFSKLEGCANVHQLAGRDCLVITSTARSEDAVRGYDLKMAHLTEVAFWPQTAQHNPDDIVRTVGGTVPPAPDTVVVYESTANGVGQFFHTEWLRAQAGQSDKTPLFVPWHEIELYRRPVAACDASALWRSLDEYERRLWADGCTLEMLAWYHDKRREYSSHALMMSEFPSNDVEAFTQSGRAVFDADHLAAMRADCRGPLAVGDVHSAGGVACLDGVRFVAEGTGRLQVWRHPDPLAPPGRYVVAVDVGGRTDKADYSVIAVMDTFDRRSRRPEVVAQWRGHTDHDLLAYKAAQVATYYRRALLVVESNTLETESDTDGGAFILERLARLYRQLYVRRGADGAWRPGFQTNRRTKRHLVYTLIGAVRDRAYVERDHLAIDEMATYEVTPRGGFGAMAGHHDDIVMTRGIALSVLTQLAPPSPPISEADKAVLAGDPWETGEAGSRE